MKTAMSSFTDKVHYFDYRTWTQTCLFRPLTIIKEIYVSNNKYKQEIYL